MPRDAVSRTAHVGTVGTNGLKSGRGGIFLTSNTRTKLHRRWKHCVCRIATFVKKNLIVKKLYRIVSYEKSFEF